MPTLGSDMETGILVEWLVKPGDAVRRGDVVAVVETAKGAIDVEIFQDGVVDTLVAAEGSEVPVGGVLATLKGPGAQAATVGQPRAPAAEGLAARTAPPAPPAIGPATPPVMPPVVPPATPALAPRAPTVRASPLARRLAGELGVDLAGVEGSGPGGAITRADVERAGAGPAATDRSAAMRQAVAAVTARSKREVPHYYLATDIDLGRALAWLAAENERRPLAGRLLAAALQVKAVALAAREVPEVNGHWLDGALRPAEGAHVALAVSLRGGGLVAPVLRDADRRDIDELMATLHDLVNRARAERLRSSEVTGGTITITNLGEQGVSTVYGIIQPPQVAMVGFGKVTERPWAEAGQLVVRPVVTATLAADHRASDGHAGARFLAAVDRLLQQPEAL
jgi:pyruvate dehydrogenase E2 component (dihydrolipoamide acetyltransferase)